MAEESTTAPGQTRVAIVGTGMAGLVTAYLLHQDPKRRYSITVFEQGDKLSLDAASVNLHDEHGNLGRVDLPMRTFDSGFYRHLLAMYNHLGITYKAFNFIFAFAETNGETGEAYSAPYFIHSHGPNYARLPPVALEGSLWMVRYLFQIIYLLTMYSWFNFCCYVFAPRTDETFGHWSQRVWLPRRFCYRYIMPVLASQATCSHEEYLENPASDVVAYKKVNQKADHYVVSDGTQFVEKALSQGIDQRLRTEVVKVEPQPGDGGVAVTWRHKGGATSDEKTETEVFHRVVMAVPPDVVARIFPRLKDEMSKIPVVAVDSCVLKPKQGVTTSGLSKLNEVGRKFLRPGVDADTYALLKTGLKLNPTRTESWYTADCGAIVRIANVTEEGKSLEVTGAEVIHRYQFRRVLRTPKTRRIVNEILLLDQQGKKQQAAQESRTQNVSNPDLEMPESTAKRTAQGQTTEKPSGKWKNGDDDIWLVGSWCWDGMVLLEGCIVSASRVARCFDVEVPWKVADEHE